MSKENILSRIKKSKKSISDRLERSQIVKKRLLKHPQNLIPKRSRGGKRDLINLFIREAERVQSEISFVKSLYHVPMKVSEIVKGKNFPHKVKYAPSLRTLPWETTLLKAREGAASDIDKVTVTRAFAGVAETGTLVLLSGEESPTSLSLLPEINIVLLDSDRIFAAYEDVWDSMRKEQNSSLSSPTFLPRSVNFITGPSRTADIEQTLMLGVHGPQSLHILVIRNDPSIEVSKNSY